MAQLTVLDPFEGPGEQLTCDYLVKNLPDDWHVIANRKLPSGNSVDIDFFVVGLNRVFVVEEKHWGPELVMSDQRWEVIKPSGRSDFRTNPFNAASAKARKSAGWLRDSVAELQYLRGHFVDSVVLLSYPNLTLRVQTGFRVPAGIMQLEGCEEFFLNADTPVHSESFKSSRQKILSRIFGLESIDRQLAKIGDYEVKAEIPGPTGIRCFEAEHPHLGETVLLKCYDNVYWRGQSQDPQAIISRETESLKRLGEIQRTWSYLPPFEFLEKDWRVAPFRKPAGYRPLVEFANELRAKGGESDLLQLCLESFIALKEVHSEGVIHKILAPSRIWVGRGMRIIFSDFFMSHIDDERTIIAGSQDAESNDYRFPDAHLIDSATEACDVYSLSIILASMFVGMDVLDKPALIQRVLEAPPGTVLWHLKAAMQDNLEEVPSADSMSIKFQSLAIPKEVTSDLPLRNEAVFEVGRLINNRFELLERLGEGGAATTWKVRDREFGDEIALLKLFKDADHFSRANHEFGFAILNRHYRCPETKEFHRSPEPGFMLLEYIPGVSLLEFSKTPAFTTETARRISLQILEVLQFFHSKGYAHGDISPSNIIIGENQDAFLIDLGLVTEFGEKPKGGTKAYMAPELAVVGKKISAKTDIFSLAATMLRSMLNRDLNLGRFSKDRAILVSEYLVDAEKEQWGDDGVRLISAFLRGLSSDPTLRPDSAEHFARVIRSAIPLPPSKLPKIEAKPLVNPKVGEIRKLYVRSKSGSTNILGLDSEFSSDTYIQTKLDTALIPQITSGEFDVVVLTGNPGDGKTSFLQRLELHLSNIGQLKNKNSSGWTYSVAEREFRAVLDASESYGPLSSDELVTDALKSEGTSSVTTLLAMNDGRLRQFFRDNEEMFPDYSLAVERFFSIGELVAGRFLIVDLKNRSLATFDHSSLMLEIGRTLTRESNWTTCDDCSANPTCPIFQNRNDLVGGFEYGLNYLASVSHLRRNKRATVRQVRSAISWAITGDLDCEDVHSLVEDGLTDLTLYTLPELVFSAHSGDALVEEWKELDPSRLVDTEIQHELSVKTRSALEFALEYERALRRRFFETLSSSHALNGSDVEIVPFRHLDEFRQILHDPDEPSGLRKILLGISRIVGATGVRSTGLAVRVSDEKSSWAVLKPFPSSDFRLEVRTKTSHFLETSPDQIFLVHTVSGSSLPINLDRAEVILRFAAGEIQLDVESEAIRFDIAAFARGLIRQASKSLVIVQPSGRASQAVMNGDIISLEPIPSESED